MCAKSLQQMFLANDSECKASQLGRQGEQDSNLVSLILTPELASCRHTTSRKAGVTHTHTHTHTRARARVRARGECSKQLTTALWGFL